MQPIPLLLYCLILICGVPSLTSKLIWSFRYPMASAARLCSTISRMIRCSITFGFAFYFTKHFYFNTTINGNDFSGKTVILFATSGGSSISNSEKELQKTYSNLKWQKGKLLNGATKEDIKQWTKK